MKRVNPSLWLGCAQRLLEEAKALSKKAVREKDKKKRQDLVNSIRYTIHKSERKVLYFYRELYSVCDTSKIWKQKLCWSIGKVGSAPRWDGRSHAPNATFVTMCDQCDKTFQDHELVIAEGRAPRIPYHKPLRKRS